jgi:hypothetical protein
VPGRCRICGPIRAVITNLRDAAENPAPQVEKPDSRTGYQKNASLFREGHWSLTDTSVHTFKKFLFLNSARSREAQLVWSLNRG